MLVEALASLALLGLVLGSVFEAHRSLTTLSQKGASQEAAEQQLLSFHRREALSQGDCDEREIVTSEGSTAISRVCCKHIVIDRFKKQRTTTVCGIKESGYGILNFLLAALFLALLLSISYPSMKQFLVERRIALRNERIQIGFRNLAANIERTVIDNQPLGLPSLNRLLERETLLEQEVNQVPNPQFRPHPQSPILLTATPNVNEAFPVVDTINKQMQMKQLVVVCSPVPKKPDLIILFSPFASSLARVSSVTTVPHHSCPENGLQLEYVSLEKESAVPVLGIAPLEEAELLYLDTVMSIRRYSLVKRQTTPIAYGYDRFLITPLGDRLILQVREAVTGQQFQFSVPLKARDAGSTLSLFL